MVEMAGYQPAPPPWRLPDDFTGAWQSWQVGVERTEGGDDAADEAVDVDVVEGGITAVGVSIPWVKEVEGFAI